MIKFDDEFNVLGRVTNVSAQPTQQAMHVFTIMGAIHATVFGDLPADTAQDTMRGQWRALRLAMHSPISTHPHLRVARTARVLQGYDMQIARRSAAESGSSAGAVAALSAGSGIQLKVPGRDIVEPFPQLLIA